MGHEIVRISVKARVRNNGSIFLSAFRRGALPLVCNGGVSVMARCPHSESRLYTLKCNLHLLFYWQWLPIDANLYRFKLRLINPLLFQENLWEWLIKICQPILLALDSRGEHLKRAYRSQAGGFSAVFVYCTTLKTFLQAFQAKNGAKEPRLKAECERKMENTIPFLRQENIEVLHNRLSWNFEKIHFLFYRKHLILWRLIRLSWKLILVKCS